MSIDMIIFKVRLMVNNTIFIAVKIKLPFFRELYEPILTILFYGNYFRSCNLPGQLVRHGIYLFFSCLPSGFSLLYFTFLY